MVINIMVIAGIMIWTGFSLSRRLFAVCQCHYRRTNHKDVSPNQAARLKNPYA